MKISNFNLDIRLSIQKFQNFEQKFRVCHGDELVKRQVTKRFGSCA